MTNIVLSNPTTQNPYTVTGAIIAPSGVAVLGQSGTVWTVTNTGIIEATSTASNGEGVELVSGGTVINEAGDLISGGNDGVFMPDGGGTVANYGTILGTNGIGIDIAGAGQVINGQSGGSNWLIKGGAGVDIEGAGTVSNFGA